MKIQESSQPISWPSFYSTFPGGSFRITKPALLAIEMTHPSRLLDAMIAKVPSRVLLLDKPMRLGESIPGSQPEEYSLHRIHLGDLPGWPPKLAPIGEVLGLGSFRDFRVASARLDRNKGLGQDGVELKLHHGRYKLRAWLTGLPTPLLHCVVATLGRDEAAGARLRDLDRVRLICPGPP